LPVDIVFASSLETSGGVLKTQYEGFYFFFDPEQLGLKQWLGKEAEKQSQDCLTFTGKDLTLGPSKRLKFMSNEVGISCPISGFEGVIKGASSALSPRMGESFANLSEGARSICTYSDPRRNFHLCSRFHLLREPLICITWRYMIGFNLSF
jgi:hypothetical protein